ncbi:conserved repeat protein, partial [Xenococcus sp. PCC 7305]
KNNTGFNDNDGSGDISVGDDVFYDLTATNVPVAFGGANLTNVVITDDLTGDTSTPVTLAPGESDTLSISYTVQDSDLGTEIDNIGTADSDQTDPITDPEFVPVPESTLDISKTNTGFTDNDGSGDISIGDDILYDLTAINIPVAFGGANLTNVVISDDLTGDTSTPVTLAPGESDTLSVSYTVLESDLGTTIANTGVADSDQTDPVTDIEGVPVPDPELSVVKTNTGFTDNDDNGFISVGDDVLYDITATNTGDTNLTNVVISDDLTGDTSAPTDLAPGESDTLSVSYTVQDSDVGTTIANVGVADSDQTDPVTEPEEV